MPYNDSAECREQTEDQAEEPAAVDPRAETGRRHRVGSGYVVDGHIVGPGALDGNELGKIRKSRIAGVGLRWLRRLHDEGGDDGRE